MRLKILTSLILMLGLTTEAAFAESGAVNRWNLDISPSLFDVDNAGSGLDLLTEMSFPLAPILGMGVFVNGTVTSGDYETDAVGSALGAEIFLGHHNIGRVGAGIASAETVYTDLDDDDYSVEDEPTVSSDLQKVFAEGYLGDFTLFASSTKDESELENSFFAGDYPELTTTMFGLQFYPTDNISLTIGKYKEEDVVTETIIYLGVPVEVNVEREADGTLLGFEAQAGRMVSIFAKYQQIEYDEDFGFDGEKLKSLFVGVTIYIRGGESLKENDRRY
jgi:hypothetical protein